MIIERVPLNPRSPRHRALRVAGLGVPVLLLAGVVTVGALGPQAETPPVAEDAPASSAVALEVPASAVPADDAPAPDAAPARVAYPQTVLGFPVMSVAATLEVHRRNPLAHVLAVAGHLTIQGLQPACADRWLGSFGASCEGRTVLADSPTRPFPTSTGGGAGFGALGPHLHPRFPAGVRLPPELVTDAAPEGSPVPVVVLGRFAPQLEGACAGRPDRCDEAFTVERVAWVAGRLHRGTTMVSPGYAVDWKDVAWRERRAAARAALGQDRPLLASAYLEPSGLAAVDPAAADALRRALAGDPAATGALAGPLWYVRGVALDEQAARLPSGAAAPRVVWVVVDDATGRVLARGTELAGASGSS